MWSWVRILESRETGEVEWVRTVRAELAELRKAGSRVGTSPWSSVPSVHPQVGVNSLKIQTLKMNNNSPVLSSEAGVNLKKCNPMYPSSVCTVHTWKSRVRWHISSLQSPLKLSCLQPNLLSYQLDAALSVWISVCKMRLGSVQLCQVFTWLKCHSAGLKEYQVSLILQRYPEFVNFFEMWNAIWNEAICLMMILQRPKTDQLRYLGVFPTTA